jgi:hypothetical protein
VEAGGGCRAKLGSRKSNTAAGIKCQDRTFLVPSQYLLAQCRAASVARRQVTMELGEQEHHV